MEALVEVVLQGVVFFQELLFFILAAIYLLLLVDQFLVVDHLDQLLLALLPALVDCLQLFVKLVDALGYVGLVALEVVGLLVRLNLVDARLVDQLVAVLLVGLVHHGLVLVDFLQLFGVAQRVFIFLVDEACASLVALADQVLFGSREKLADIEEVLLLGAHEHNYFFVSDGLDTEFVLAAVIYHRLHGLEDQVAFQVEQYLVIAEV